MEKDFLTKVLARLTEVEDQQKRGVLTEAEAETQTEHILLGLQAEVLQSHK